MNNRIYKFKYKGSANEPYEIELLITPFSIKCSCPGYRFKNTCKHTKQIICGDVKNIIEGDVTIVKKLQNNPDIILINKKMKAEKKIEEIKKQISFYLELYETSFIANKADANICITEKLEYLNNLNQEISKLADVFITIYGKENISHYFNFNNLRISDLFKIGKDGDKMEWK